jgi:CHRD domain
MRSTRGGGTVRKLTLLISALLLGAVVAATSVSAATATKKTITVKNMTGAQEVPKGSPTGKGNARISLDSKKGQVCFALAWSKIDTVTASHIHKAPKGKAGPILVAFFAGAPKHSGCVSASKSVVAAIIKSPGAYYVNIHTKKYPAGAIRGQL